MQRKNSPCPISLSWYSSSSSNWILMSCQPYRVTSGQSNSGHKQIHISKLFSHIYQPSVKSVYKTNSTCKSLSISALPWVAEAGPHLSEWTAQSHMSSKCNRQVYNKRVCTKITWLILLQNINTENMHKTSRALILHIFARFQANLYLCWPWDFANGFCKWNPLYL